MAEAKGVQGVSVRFADSRRVEMQRRTCECANDKGEQSRHTRVVL